MTFKHCFIYLGSLSLLLWLLYANTRIVIAASQSLPHRVYVVIKGSTPQKGDIITIQDHRVSGKVVPHLTKRLRGIEGDRISIQDGVVSVNQDTIGSLKIKTRFGTSVHPIRAKVIPKGYVFVQSDHPHSFDSRYQEFGLVKVDQIVGRSIPLW